MKKGTISRNIGLLMEHFGIRSEAQLAKQIGMPQTTLNKLTTGISPDPKISTLAPIANYFKISIDTLLSDHPTFTNKGKYKQSQLLVPLISYNELVDLYGHLDSLTSNTWPHWYPIPFQQKNTSSYYAIQVFVGQLSKPFDRASILILKNESQILDNFFCLIKHLNSQSISIKKVLFDNGKRWLLPLQTELPTAEFNAKKWQILGTIQAYIIDISNNSFIFSGESDE